MTTCPTCNKGKLVKKIVDYSVYGTSLGKFPAEACTGCGESYFDENIALEIERLEKERGLFGVSVRSKISYSGNALIIRIPQKIAKILHLKEGREVILHPDDGNEKLTVEIL
ncbi:MAG TPA: AbrB/MazE/SpoVT family DNA-binding domain-containing protein [Candidatus Nanoarchaeia archaeon]|nr:AbrB/MazE/SpoVT family DNA-binding domain-containing protein [Candidatus Nanoarchaeia archaeon]